jgi:beta-galactosidase
MKTRFGLTLVLGFLLLPGLTHNIYAAATRSRTQMDGSWQFYLGEVPGYSLSTPGTPVTQWICIADDSAPSDAATMAAPGLNTSTWTNVTVGTDVFGGRVGSAWFRSSLTNLASAVRPLTLHFLGVDDNATVYLNGVQIGYHAGWSQPFDIVVDPASISAGTNILAVAVNNSGGGPGGIMSPVLLQSGPDNLPPGTPVTQWFWQADDNAPNDAATKAATNLNLSGWAVVTNGQDVFTGHVGAGWFRATLDPVASTNRPLTMHFVCVDDNATFYLNGVLLGRHTGSSQPFDISPLDSAWVNGGPNILAVAVQNNSGPGGIVGPVTLESGIGIQSSGNTTAGPWAMSYDDHAWRTVHLPHDYIIEGTFASTAEASHGSLPMTSAWYRCTFNLPQSALGQSIWVDFDGVYHNSKVWFNGHYLGYWYSGYASFRYDLSRFAIPGGTNVLAVHVDPTGDEGWWYEGGGIYRHVWINIANPLHIAPWGTLVTSAVQGPDASGNASATLTILTIITNSTSQPQFCTLISQPAGPDGVAAGTASTPLVIAAGTSSNVIQTIQVTNARLWSLETPQLYQLQSSLQQLGQPIDITQTPFGIRSIYFDVNNGFFLNGKRVELKGMCNHQDHAGVGIGMPDSLLYWRIKTLKSMGCNAYRCSHNPPAAELLDACDRLGMLVMDENRHLGDATGAYSSANAQTTYSDLSPLNSMILRDRNHPSIIIWSMCNEESASGTQAGADIFYAMKQRVLQFDTSRPISCAMNGGWFNVGISLVEDLEGINYSSGQYDPFHAAYPNQPVYGSESSSAQSDRGMYTNDSIYYVSSFNTTTENAWQPVGTRPFMAGSFIWTGFDYKGEPSPFGWPCISSKYGVIDSCGLPKDAYYYYQAWWKDPPLVHVFPHWNWTTGQSVSVWCYANTASVELFLNGVSQGVQSMPAYGHVAWTVPYAPGTLLAKGYDSHGAVIATNQVATTGVPAGIQLMTDRTSLSADGEDLVVVYAAIMDGQGLVVPIASNQVTFSVSGPAWVAGVGNGDPASHEPDRASQRLAFNGWCMALVNATNSAGAITLTATSPGLTSATLNLQALALSSPPAPISGLTATPGTASIKLDWPINLAAASYNIKRANVSGGPYTTIANYTAASFTDTTVTNSVPYYYVVSAVNSNGESANSSEVSATPISPAAASAPSGVLALADDGQVGVSWNAVAGATGYRVKRARSSAGPYSPLSDTAATAYTDTAVTNNGTYYYVVSTLSSSPESTNSLPASATPITMSYLVGTITGTTGSWSNAGNTREKAMDGDVNSFFDAPTGNGDWVGLDLGTNAGTNISKINYYPRSGYQSRMAGGVFQGGNAADFSDAVTFYTIASSPPVAMNSLLNSNKNSFRYMRYLAPANGFGNVAELEFYTPGPRIYRATGTVIGTAGASTNTSDKVFDGNLATYFDAASSNGNWIGLDLGSAKVITAVRYCPRSGYGNVMLNGVFQGANASDFTGATNLCIISNTPPDLTLTAQAVKNTNAVRYVRYLSPTNSYGDIAELQFFTSTPSTSSPPAAPTNLVATAGNQEISLTWSNSPGAASYNIKRASISGGPYTNIANRLTTIHIDSGLGYGAYYYVVSAVSSAGESSNSVEASAILTCTLPPAPIGLAATIERNGAQLSWSAATGATGYNVLRSTTSGGPYNMIAGGIVGTSYTDSTITSGPAYYYVVQSANACGAGTNSQQAAIASLPSPALSATANGSGLWLSWPTWAGNYGMDSATNLTPPIAWGPLANAAQITNGIFYLNLSLTNDLQFYRLRLPISP